MSRFTCFCFVAVALWAAALGGRRAPAQVLRGDWVKRSQQRIDKLRKRDLRVIVIGRDGKSAAHVTVHLQQRRHAFTLGFVAPANGQSQGKGAASSFWRVINAVSLERVGAWSNVRPSADRPADYAAVDAVLKRARQRHWAVRWGPIVSQDPAENPDWAVDLKPAALGRAVWGRLDAVLGRYGQVVASFDVTADGIDHAMLRSQLGDNAVSRLYHRAKAIAPGAVLCVRADDALNMARVGRAFSVVRQARQSFFPFSRVAFTEHTQGTLAQAAVARVMDRLSAMRPGVVIADLEVENSTAAGAAVSMETLLRTLFASPRVRGIYLDALTPAQASDPHAALLSARGEPTAVGKVVASLFGKLWWSSLTRRTDELGNVRARVFAGAYTVTASLPDGTTMRGDVWVGSGPKAPEPRVVVLSPLTSDPKGKGKGEAGAKPR